MTFHNTTLKHAWLTDAFDPISLDELNEKAEMLSRIDNKYVVKKDALEEVICEIAGDFDILDINQCRAFTYNTRYFDNLERSAYYEHHQGLRKGFKVRVRKYTDAGIAFLEVKVKGARGETVKHRFPYDPNLPEVLSQTDIAAIKATYFNHYGKEFTYELTRSLDLEYKRITLVAKQGEERMTIDTGLQFWFGGKSVRINPDVFIVETKSKLGRGLADVTFRKAHQRPTKKCSKYCVGVAALGEVSRWNRFIPTMRKMDLIKGMTFNPEFAIAA